MCGSQGYGQRRGYGQRSRAVTGGWTCRTSTGSLGTRGGRVRRCGPSRCTPRGRASAAARRPETRRPGDLVLDSGAWPQLAGSDRGAERVRDLLVEGNVGRTVDHDVYLSQDDLLFDSHMTWGGTACAHISPETWRKRQSRT